MRTLTVAALNVVMPAPHSPDRYVELFRRAMRLKKIVLLRGNYAGMLGSVQLNAGLVTGQLYKFFDLQLDQPWFDIVTRQAAADEDVASIQIPPHLKPQYEVLDYVFVPAKHRLFFVAAEKENTLSPNMARTLFNELFNDQRLQQNFGVIDITVEPKREQLASIFELPVLKKLFIEITPPNPDDLEDAEQDVYARMSGERAGRMKIELDAKDDEGLIPDEDHRTLAKVAQSNGKVSGSGIDAKGKRVRLSTTQHAFEERVKYNPAVQGPSDALWQIAQKLLNRLRG